MMQRSIQLGKTLKLYRSFSLAITAFKQTMKAGPQAFVCL
jgi:hypothetical protein